MAAPWNDPTSMSNLMAAAIDRDVRIALYATPIMRTFATVHPTNQTAPGQTVTLAIRGTMTDAVTPLSPTVDPTGVSLSNPTQVTITLARYGNLTKVDGDLTTLTFDTALQASVVKDIYMNQVNSVDALVQVALAAGTNDIKEVSSAMVVNGAGTVDSVAKARDFRTAVTKLRAASVPTFDGVNYVSVVHPNVSLDIRTESGGSWLAAQQYGMSHGLQGLYAGEIGVYEGARFIENPRCTVAGGIYNSYVIGQDAVAEAVADEFHVVVDGTISDPLDRFVSVGWTGIGGWAHFRDEASWKINTTASLG